MTQSKEYDFVIIGSGMGGLCCAYILASEGYSVKVLEKNSQIGGNLQVFSRDKCLFDTGVHYVGSLDDGLCLNQFFKYFGILDKLKMKRMDSEQFDVIQFADGKTYKYGQGYDTFKKNLLADFPNEEEAIDNYCLKMQEVCEYFPLYNLKTSDKNEFADSLDILEINTAQFIESITNNVRLQNVLAGSNPLYAGIKDKSPFFVHSLVVNSYITGSYRFINGGSQIAIQLTKRLKAFGGEVQKYANVIGANYNDQKEITEVILESGETIKGKKFISNAHPAKTIDIFGEERFLRAYRTRVKSLENTISTFILHLVLKKDSFKYRNYNTYYHRIEDVWDGGNYTAEDWPRNFYVSMTPHAKNEDYADGITVMAYMRYSEMEKWADTENTVANPAERGESYAAFKKQKEETLIASLEEIIPNIRECIQSVHSSTPLTYRDYIGDTEGSLYGILKDSNSPARSMIAAKTKIPNLYLTGQNMIFHGILGVTIGAFVTCFNFIDKETLVKKINSF